MVPSNASEQRSTASCNSTPAHDAPDAAFPSPLPSRPAPRVALVGAGPGNPGLLTLRAVECLADAEFVLYDRLVPARILDYVSASARRLCVDELPGCHPDRWPLIYQAMIDAARQGLRVVRLKGGDPLIFGRGGEEAAALRLAGIDYEIVPGVTAASGAAAFAGIPLTHRLHASAVAFVTGHEKLDQNDTRVDWAALARFPGTLVIYMGVTRITGLVAALLENGKAANTPSAAISWASLGQQQTVEAALADLPKAVTTADLKAPALIIIGAVVGLRPDLKWFENLPLFGKRILVTRPRRQAADLVHRLELLGAKVLVMPGVEIRDPPDWGPVDHAITVLSTYHWLVFTSANGVHRFLGRLKSTGCDLRALGHLQLSAIGPATADALRAYHLEPDVVPSTFRSENLAAELKTHVAGKRVLLARADRGREVLQIELAQFAEVDQVAVYAQVDAELDAGMLASLQQNEIDLILFMSSNIARSILSRVNEMVLERIRSGALQLVTISPVTSGAVLAMSLPVAAEAKEYTADGVLKALCELVNRQSEAQS